MTISEMVALAEPRAEVSVLRGSELLSELHTEQRERILELLNSPTMAYSARQAELREAAAVRRAEVFDRRSGCDRRSGRERRMRLESTGSDRRSSRDRRAGLDRRRGRLMSSLIKHARA
jgi:hypothetical protein